MLEEIYTSGEYLKKNPTWHIGESPWKAREIMRMLRRNNIVPETICEVGCGAGEVLKQLQEKMDRECSFWGYEISPQAFELSKSRANSSLHFKLMDIKEEKDAYYDLILIMDVIEHMEDYFSLLRAIKNKSSYKIIQLPIDLSVRSVLFGYLIDWRKRFGHIHYFDKEVALQMLQDMGYEVLDYFYTSESFTPAENPPKKIERNPLKLLKKSVGNFKRALPTWFEALLFAIHQDLAVRVMGRRRLLLLVK